LPNILKIRKKNIFTLPLRFTAPSVHPMAMWNLPHIIHDWQVIISEKHRTHSSLNKTQNMIHSPSNLNITHIHGEFFITQPKHLSYTVI
jgi:hypothetical protein